MDESSLSRQEYPVIVASLSPGQAVTVVNERVKQIGKVNSEIANWLQERRKVEEAYVQGLKKLARLQPPDSQSELGIFTAPWNKIVSSVNSIAESHHMFATGIEKDVEQPLRTWVTKNRESQAMTTIQGNLAAMAKELEDAQATAEKLSRKGHKANSLKVDNAQEKLGIATSQWESQAPYVFEKLQAVDELRLNHLRDALTQYQTHESDQIARTQSTAEATLISIVELDVSEEVRNFTRNSVQGRPKLDRGNRRTSSTTSASIARTSATGSASLPPPPARPSGDDADSETSGRTETPSEPKNKGLKRFGTMLGRARRQSVHGSFQRAPSPSKGLGAINPFGGRNLSSREGRPSPSPRGSSNNLRDSPSRENRLSSLAESPTTPNTIHAGTPAERRRSRDITNGNLNGITPGSSLIDDTIPPRATSQTTNGALQKDLPDLSDVQPPPGPPPSHFKPEPVRQDSEGFTLPGAANDPISLAQQEAADENDQQQFKLDIKNEPIQEEGDDAQAALANVANTLRSASTLATPSRKAGTIRGRRDVRNTIYVPTPETSDLSKTIDNNIPPSPQPHSTTRAGALATLSSEHSNLSDTQSIRSARSLTSQTTLKHPDLHEPGLNASIIETVNAYFENGEIKTANVIGELALVHHAEAGHLSGNETIRLDNFSALEAIAPNHTFINEISADKPGEYIVELPHIAKTTVAFRYKVHVDESNLATFAPMILKPAWKPTGDKLGVVLEYSLNPAFSSKPITLKNLVLMVTWEGAKVAGCQTKPTATFLKDKHLAYWRLGDVTLNTTTQKVIGRFIGAEGGEPKPGNIEARWEVQGSAEQAVGSGLGVSRLDIGKGKEREASPDPFADESVASTPLNEGHWVTVDSSRKVVGGKYDAKQVIDKE